MGGGEARWLTRIIFYICLSERGLFVGLLNYHGSRLRDLGGDAESEWRKWRVRPVLKQRDPRCTGQGDGVSRFFRDEIKGKDVKSLDIFFLPGVTAIESV